MPGETISLSDNACSAGHTRAADRGRGQPPCRQFDDGLHRIDLGCTCRRTPWARQMLSTRVRMALGRLRAPADRAPSPGHRRAGKGGWWRSPLPAPGFRGTARFVTQWRRRRPRRSPTRPYQRWPAHLRTRPSATAIEASGKRRRKSPPGGESARGVAGKPTTTLPVGVSAQGLQVLLEVVGQLPAGRVCMVQHVAGLVGWRAIAMR